MVKNLQLLCIYLLVALLQMNALPQVFIYVLRFTVPLFTVLVYIYNTVIMPLICCLWSELLVSPQIAPGRQLNFLERKKCIFMHILGYVRLSKG